MMLRSERVILDQSGVQEDANFYVRFRRITVSICRNDRARQENALYAADRKLPGPQVWEGDDA